MQTEKAVLALARRLSRATAEESLVFAGGVALNCVANARLERVGPFRSLFIPGAAHDAGTAVGAALALVRGSNERYEEKRIARRKALTPFLGRAYTSREIDAAIAQSGFAYERVSDPAAAAAALLAEGKLVGWFQDRMEFGPRALGNRSLLADPRRAAVRDELNRRIKHREPFRPFGASVLAEDAEEWFAIPRDRAGARSCRGFMILAYSTRPERAASIPAVVHRDGTCRVQLVEEEENPLLHSLLRRFRDRTAVPLILNTSFNDQEPLVSTPEDALQTFARAQIEVLFLGDRLVRRAR
jgi:carbamoyltransferase